MAIPKIFILFTTLLSIIAINASAYDIKEKNIDGVTIYYNYINNKTELEVTTNGSNTPYYSYSGTVIIPKEVTYNNKTLKITSIGKHAFYMNINLTSITIGNNVTSIEACAFTGCSSLTSVTIPNSVTNIRMSAFSGCTKLVSISIPNSVTNIEKDAFIGCSNLTYVTIPNGLNSIEKETFSGCNNLISITIPPNVIKIEESAFSRCKSLKSITIPDNVMSIGHNAFKGCTDLKSITIPKNVKSIGYGVFYGIDMQKVISKIDDPFIIATETFSDNTYFQATLYVPKGTIDKYKTTDGWKNFINIIEEGGDIETSIYDITSQVDVDPITINTREGQLVVEGADDNTIIEAFTLDGAKIASTISKNGIALVNTNIKYNSIIIVRIGEMSMKVLLKK